MRNDPLRNQRGFTLLEVLVAAVIAALALGLLSRGGLAGLLAARTAGQVQEATSRARSRLAAIGHAGPVRALEVQGDDGGGYRWRLRIAPLATAPAGRGDPAAVARLPHATLYAATVWIDWGAHEVRLDTLVTDTAPQAAP